jgi:hypothetical protein
MAGLCGVVRAVRADTARSDDLRWTGREETLRDEGDNAHLDGKNRMRDLYTLVTSLQLPVVEELIERDRHRETRPPQRNSAMPRAG